MIGGEGFFHFWYTVRGRNYEPVTYEFTDRFYLVGLNMFIISSVSLPLQALWRYSANQYKIRKVPVIKAIYFFTLFVRKAVSVLQIFWELKDAFFLPKYLYL